LAKMMRCGAGVVMTVAIFLLAAHGSRIGGV